MPPRDDRLNNVLHGRDMTWHRLCNICYRSISKEPVPPAQRSRKDNSLIPESHEGNKDHVRRRMGRRPDHQRILQLWLGWWLCQQKFNIGLHLHAQRGSSQLVFKVTIHSSPLIDRSGIYSVDIGGKKNNMATTLANKTRPTTPHWSVHRNQSHGWEQGCTENQGIP